MINAMKRKMYLWACKYNNWTELKWRMVILSVWLRVSVVSSFVELQESLFGVITPTRSGSILKKYVSRMFQLSRCWILASCYRYDALQVVYTSVAKKSHTRAEKTFFGWHWNVSTRSWTVSHIKDCEKGFSRKQNKSTWLTQSKMYGPSAKDNYRGLTALHWKS